MAAKKAAFIIIRLSSTGKTKEGKATGYFYVSRKSRRKTEKVQLMKYDPRAYDKKAGRTGAHVLFKEEKIK